MSTPSDVQAAIWAWVHGPGDVFSLDEDESRETGEDAIRQLLATVTTLVAAERARVEAERWPRPPSNMSVDCLSQGCRRSEYEAMAYARDAQGIAEAMAAERERWEEYVSHTALCELFDHARGPQSTCTCGLDTIRQGLRRDDTETPPPEDTSPPGALLWAPRPPSEERS